MSETEADPLQPFYSLVDRCIQNTPLVVLGSGGSIDAGFPGMKALGDKICHTIESTVTIPTNEQAAWENFKSHFSEHGDFEKALDQLERAECVHIRTQVVEKAWEIITAVDKQNYNQLITTHTLLPLSKLFGILARGNAKALKLVTTNYDRMAEYAAELAGFHHYTGFNYGYMRLWDDEIRQMPLTVARRIIRNNDALTPNNKLVDIWKVHGSIDWFKVNGTGKIFAVPFPDKPENTTPLIVTPGIIKYQTCSSDAPFHVILEEAKRSIEESKAYLCVGYGFNDSHIQPNLLTKLQNQRTPVYTIVLVQKLTDKGRELFLGGQIANFLVLEQEGTSTRIYTPDHLGGIVVNVPNLWTLDGFLQNFRRD